jgi:GNAT superfamily N-acetyltransferase
MRSTANERAVAIRASEPRDYARMADLAGQLTQQSSAEEIARRVLCMQRSLDHAVFVAETPQGEVAGWIGVFVYQCVEADARAEISGLVVDEGARSLGIGRRLVERAEEWAREKGCGTVGVRSNVIRDRAHAFYEGLGYKHIKTQKSFRKTLGDAVSKSTRENAG